MPTGFEGHVSGLNGEEEEEEEFEVTPRCLCWALDIGHPSKAKEGVERRGKTRVWLYRWISDSFARQRCIWGVVASTGSLYELFMNVRAGGTHERFTHFGIKEKSLSLCPGYRGEPPAAPRVWGPYISSRQNR